MDRSRFEIVNVALDHMKTPIPAYVDRRERWNGALCPRFERAQAELVVNDVNDTYEPGDGLRAFWVDALVALVYDDPDKGIEIIRPDSNGWYAIADGWCWWEWTEASDGDDDGTSSSEPDSARVVDQWSPQAVLGFDVDPRQGNVICPHRDVAVCPKCLRRLPDRLVEMGGQHFLTDTPYEAEILRSEAEELRRDLERMEKGEQ
ncbi:hypothetical protein NLX83_15680 [Allokutzneria sp. A3M-2-11 16]|uniref:hypothetical protein n=1 Tax=Allokutzneria sp. A3M-2-11 16 TaxID=2962043 RepID=UPI0020B65CB6|nr:hypothetical protein [Allokutzneria sp. A3M-2-11 16]MCP3800708.1 hypothetical protein [Allokutzneria sp. A3M-2-11 16]